MTLAKPRNVHDLTRCKHSRDAVDWIHLERHRRKAQRFRQAKSHAVIAYSTVPPDSVERVISQLGEMTIYHRSSTPRTARRWFSKGIWHEQQQQDVIYQAEERITKRQTLVDRLQDGYRTKSIVNDLNQDGFSNVFSEASRRKIKEMGNIELYELGETV